MSERCPLYSQKQTSLRAIGKSPLCQFRTNCIAAKQRPIDYLENLFATHGRIIHMGHDHRRGSNLNPAMQSVLNDEQERVSGDGKDEQYERNRDHLFGLQELHRVDDQKT